MYRLGLVFSIVTVMMVVLLGCGGNETGGEAESGGTVEGVIDQYVEALNKEDIDLLLKTIHPFSGQHIELRGYYDRDFAQYDYEVKKVSSEVSEESDTSAVVDLVITKTLVEKKADGTNELIEGEVNQKLTFKVKGEEWLIDKIE